MNSRSEAGEDEHSGYVVFSLVCKMHKNVKFQWVEKASNQHDDFLSSSINNGVFAESANTNKVHECSKTVFTPSSQLRIQAILLRVVRLHFMKINELMIL